ncbi:GL17748 [Drosophila persimilis]|uniref:GL17748 n=1 Tax=Drosophila persimilis TaxID=7234 RepID=B4HCJ4_DROPE|nr:GL17748 [Drosophila persimilis]
MKKCMGTAIMIETPTDFISNADSITAPVIVFSLSVTVRMRAAQILDLSDSATEIAQKHGFEIKGYRFTAREEQIRKPRVVRVGAIQNSIVLPTTAPIEDQRTAIWNKVTTMIKAAAAAGCNIVCTQEAWSKYLIESLAHIKGLPLF